MLISTLVVAALVAAPVAASVAVPPRGALLQEPAAGGSRITKVVVYPEHAEVTRQITVDAVEGANRVRFGGLIPLLNPHTLRASVSEGARIVGTELTTVFLEESISEEINLLDARIQELTDLLAAEADGKARLDEQAAFYGSVKQRLAGDMGRELAQERLAVAEWDALLEFVRDGLRRCDDERRAVALAERALGKELEKRRSERKEYAGRQPKEMKEVVVSFHSEDTAARDVRIHYMVGSVAWRPSYDVRLDRDAGEIQVTGYGQVLQWTGESWTDVELALAMSRPDAELTLPELRPMVASLDQETMTQLVKEVSFLNTLPQEQLETWATGRFKRRQDRETFRRNVEQLLGRSSKDLARFGLSAELLQGAMTRLVNRFAAVRYQVAQRETISFDSSPSKVVTFSATVPARLKYVATPALGNSVLLQGEIVNTTGYPILEGNVALFVDESFIGSSRVLGAAQNEGLSFGFGPDDALVVTRHLVSRTDKGPEAFRPSQVITSRSAIGLENFNDRNVVVEVTDQVPVSKTQDIQVTFLESDRAHTLDPQTGILRWTLDVGQGGRSDIGFSFSVECPVGTDVHWQ
jgi:uncharacterized protein (TIGR02231 family)